MHRCQSSCLTRNPNIANLHRSRTRPACKPSEIRVTGSIPPDNLTNFTKGANMLSRSASSLVPKTMLSAACGRSSSPLRRQRKVDTPNQAGAEKEANGQDYRKYPAEGLTSSCLHSPQHCIKTASKGNSFRPAANLSISLLHGFYSHGYSRSFVFRLQDLSVWYRLLH
jgi:hypothetical protein